MMTPILLSWNFVQEKYKILTYAFLDTLFGRMILVRTPYGVAYLGFVGTEPSQVESVLASLKHLYRNEVFEQVEETDLSLTEWKAGQVCLSSTVNTISNFRRSESEAPLCVQLDVRATPFQRTVWENLMQIPYGETLSYSAFADRFGRIRATRAVASAVASNPIALLIPCHRIIRQNGEYGAYRWGASRKELILNQEKGKIFDTLTLF